LGDFTPVCLLQHSPSPQQMLDKKPPATARRATYRHELVAPVRTSGSGLAVAFVVAVYLVAPTTFFFAPLLSPP